MQVCVTFYLSLNRSKIKKKLWILRLWLDRVSNRSKVIVVIQFFVQVILHRRMSKVHQIMLCELYWLEVKHIKR